MQDLMSLVNKKAGRNVAHDLTGDNPTSVKEWIPTGSRWLDSIICKGKVAGVPVGKVTEIAGLEATGKSYMAAQIAANAQKQGKLVVYFDSESAIDPSFLERSGCDLERLMYVQASSVEFVLEINEHLHVFVESLEVAAADAGVGLIGGGVDREVNHIDGLGLDDVTSGALAHW